LLVQVPTTQGLDPAGGVSQSELTQQAESLSAIQVLALVPQAHLIGVEPVQHWSALSDPPGQKSSAGQQKSSLPTPPKQTVSQQPSMSQQKPGARQHSPVDGQNSASGGRPPGRLLVAQQSSSPMQVPKQQALSQHSL
jgi:hypothetical protein